MKDIYADTLIERTHKKLPGWLGDKFSFAADKLYQLELLSLQRIGWRYANANFLRDGEMLSPTWHPPKFKRVKTAAGTVCVPQFKDPQLHGQIRKQLPEEFLKAVNLATAFLPGSMRTLIAEQGMRLKLGHIMTDIDPAYASLRCRGQDGMVINTSGIFVWRSQYAAVTHGSISPTTGKFVEDSFESTVEGVLHEFGHNFESYVFNTMGGDSWMYRAEPQQRDFFRAYRQDVIDLKGATTSDRCDLKYYLAKDNGGTQDTEAAACSETLAQLFAEKRADLHISMQKGFPRCTEVMNRMLVAVDYMVKKDPAFGHITLDRT